MNLARRLGEQLEALVDWTGRAASWLILAVVALLFLQIPMRELAHFGHNEINDIGQLCHATVFMVGVAYAMRWDGHVRVNIFYNRMSVRRKALVDLFGTLFFILPWLVIVSWDSIPIVVNSWRDLEEFAETYTSGYFLLKTQLLVFAVLVALQALANVLRDVRTLLSAPTPASR